MQRTSEERARARGWHIISGHSQKPTASSPRRTRGKATSTKPLPPLLALSEEQALPPTLLKRLRKLDDDQLAIVELVVAAIQRGAAQAFVMLGASVSVL